MDQHAIGTLFFWVFVLGLSCIALAPVAVQIWRARRRRVASPDDFHTSRIERDENGLDDGLTEYRDKADEQ